MKCIGDTIHIITWYALRASNSAIYPIITEGCVVNFLFVNTDMKINMDAEMDTAVNPIYKPLNFVCTLIASSALTDRVQLGGMVVLWYQSTSII